MEYIAKTPFLGRTLCRGPTKNRKANKERKGRKDEVERIPTYCPNYATTNCGVLTLQWNRLCRTSF